MNELKNLNWQGTELEITELFKALIEAKRIGVWLSQIEVFNRLKLFFEVDDFNESDKIREITDVINTPTLFLNNLEISLNNYSKKLVKWCKNLSQKLNWNFF